MSPLCACSVTTLEIFVRDVARISIRQPRPRLRIGPNHGRAFGTRHSARQIQPAQTAPPEDPFIPFENGSQNSTHPVSTPRAERSKKLDGDTKHTNESRIDEDWHAEIEIVAPWPQETRVPSFEATTDAAAPLGGAISVGSNDQEESSMDRDSFITSDHRQEIPSSRIGASLSDAVPFDGITSVNLNPPQTSRAENRQQRKLRRVQAGTYRKQAEMRAREQLVTSQTASILDFIKTAKAARQPVEDGSQRNSPSQEADNDSPSSASTGANTPIKAHPANIAESTASPSQGETPTSAVARPNSELKPWQIQKIALREKFGAEGWQPRKRLSPDTLEGIRALHASDPASYTTAVLAEHFKVAPEAIRRILKSKWRPSDDEAESRRLRWEKRGERKWRAMAEQGTRPPAKWRAKGIKTPQMEKKRAERASKHRRDNYVRWDDRDLKNSSPSLAGRIL